MIIVGIIAIPVLYNAIFGSRAYYIIDYDVNLSNREDIINKVENFNYTAYLNHSYIPDGYATDHKGYVDRDLINLLKSKIENHTGICSRHLHYYFLGENHSQLYLTYSNNTIFNIKDHNNQSLFLKRGRWKISWYLNFTLIPHVYSDTSSTFVLSELIFVKINLEYELTCPIGYDYGSLEQYLLVSMKLDVILIFIYSYFDYD
jgi:hypothetical protein